MYNFEITKGNAEAYLVILRSRILENCREYDADLLRFAYPHMTQAEAESLWCMLQAEDQWAMVGLAESALGKQPIGDALKECRVAGLAHAFFLEGTLGRAGWSPEDYPVAQDVIRGLAKYIRDLGV